MWTRCCHGCLNFQVASRNYNRKWSTNVFLALPDSYLQAIWSFPPLRMSSRFSKDLQKKKKNRLAIRNEYWLSYIKSAKKWNSTEKAEDFVPLSGSMMPSRRSMENPQSGATTDLITNLSWNSCNSSSSYSLKLPPEQDPPLSISAGFWSQKKMVVYRIGNVQTTPPSGFSW